MGLNRSFRMMLWPKLPILYLEPSNSPTSMPTSNRDAGVTFALFPFAHPFHLRLPLHHIPLHHPIPRQDPLSVSRRMKFVKDILEDNASITPRNITRAIDVQYSLAASRRNCGLRSCCDDLVEELPPTPNENPPHDPNPITFHTLVSPKCTHERAMCLMGNIGNLPI